MSTFSAQEDYSTILTSDQIAALTSTSTITLSSIDTSSMAQSCHTYTTVTGSSSSPTFISGITLNGSSYTTTIGSMCTPSYATSDISSIWGGAEWVDSFPAWHRIQDMCKEYPGLKIAFEKFRTTYNLVKDDYDTPKDQRPKP